MLRAGDPHQGGRGTRRAARCSVVSECQSTVGPERAGHEPSHRRARRVDPFLAQVARQRGEVLDHVAVDVDDGMRRGDRGSPRRSCGCTSVHCECGAGDHGCFVGREKGDDPRDLVRRRGPLQDRTAQPEQRRVSVRRVLESAEKSVSTELGHTQFTRTPARPNSTAIALVSITTPPFDAVYAALYGSAQTGRRRHVHDHATDVEQRIDRGLAHQEGAGEVHRDRAVPCLQREVAGGREGPIPAS